MKRTGIAVLCLVAFVSTAGAAQKSRDIHVNGKFLISSYTVNGTQVVSVADLSKLVSGYGNFTVNGGKVMAGLGSQRTLASAVPPARGGLGLKVRKELALGNAFSAEGHQWLAVTDLVKQLGAKQLAQGGAVGVNAPLQLRVFDCPDVQCCPDCGIAIR
jgi:type 1 fimbria pilin